MEIKTIIFSLQYKNKFFKISFSVSKSNEEVDSSKNKILGSLYNALANPILFCPPDIFIPLSPNLVSNPSFKFNKIVYFYNFKFLTFDN